MRALTFRDSYMSSLELRDTFPERDQRAHWVSLIARIPGGVT